MCDYIQEHLKLFCCLENGVKLPQLLSSLLFVIIIYQYKSDYIPFISSKNIFLTITKCHYEFENRTEDFRI